ncbi:hypothetical protein B7494_g6813 [Chlorociboria aeruginascens]|nr:hypothetical protein B7494_g6813 [Chlorociboria aeruginascens]
MADVPDTSVDTFQPDPLPSKDCAGASIDQLDLQPDTLPSKDTAEASIDQQDLQPSRPVVSLSQLPVELRLMIWEHTLPGPRVIEAAYQDIIWEYSGQIYKDLRIRTTITYLRIAGSMSACINRLYLDSDPEDELEEPTTPEGWSDPVALRVCQESRWYALTKYQVMKHTQGPKGCFYFNPSRDVLRYKYSLMCTGLLSTYHIADDCEEPIRAIETMLVQESEWDTMLECDGFRNDIKTIVLLLDNNHQSDNSLGGTNEGEENNGQQTQLDNNHQSDDSQGGTSENKENNGQQTQSWAEKLHEHADELREKYKSSKIYAQGIRLNIHLSITNLNTPGEQIDPTIYQNSDPRLVQFLQRCLPLADKAKTALVVGSSKPTPTQDIRQHTLHGKAEGAQTEKASVLTLSTTKEKMANMESKAEKNALLSYVEESLARIIKSSDDLYYKAYNPLAVKSAWYTWWEKEGFFKPEFTADGKVNDEGYFVIIEPPTNVTGNLHMGHAFGNVLQDIMIQYNRMCGKTILWLPGCDHTKHLYIIGCRKHSLVPAEKYLL